MISKLRAIKNILLSNGKPAAEVPSNFGFTIGKGTNLGRPRRMDGQQYISFGENCYLGKEAWISAYDNYPHSGQQFTPQITIGNNVLIGAYATITGINKIIIEDNVEISDFLYLSDHTHNINPEEGVPIHKRRLISRGYVKIGAYTALGQNVSVLPGVTLGRHCVAGSQAVITRSFPDYSLLMGNPAIMIKTWDAEKGKWIDPSPEMKARYNSL